MVATAALKMYGFGLLLAQHRSQRADCYSAI